MVSTPGVPAEMMSYLETAEDDIEPYEMEQQYSPYYQQQDSQDESYAETVYHGASPAHIKQVSKLNQEMQRYETELHTEQAEYYDDSDSYAKDPQTGEQLYYLPSAESYPFDENSAAGSGVGEQPIENGYDGAHASQLYAQEQFDQAVPNGQEENIEQTGDTPQYYLTEDGYYVDADGNYYEGEYTEEPGIQESDYSGAHDQQVPVDPTTEGDAAIDHSEQGYYYDEATGQYYSYDVDDLLQSNEAQKDFHYNAHEYQQATAAENQVEATYNSEYQDSYEPENQPVDYTEGYESTVNQESCENFEAVAGTEVPGAESESHDYSATKTEEYQETEPTDGSYHADENADGGYYSEEYYYNEDSGLYYFYAADGSLVPYQEVTQEAYTEDPQVHQEDIQNVQSTDSYVQSPESQYIDESETYYEGVATQYTPESQELYETAAPSSTLETQLYYEGANASYPEDVYEGDVNCHYYQESELHQGTVESQNAQGDVDLQYDQGYEVHQGEADDQYAPGLEPYQTLEYAEETAVFQNPDDQEVPQYQATAGESLEKQDEPNYDHLGYYDEGGTFIYHDTGTEHHFYETSGELAADSYAGNCNEHLYEASGYNEVVPEAAHQAGTGLYTDHNSSETLSASAYYHGSVGTTDGSYYPEQNEAEYTQMLHDSADYYAENQAYYGEYANEADSKGTENGSTLQNYGTQESFGSSNREVGMTGQNVDSFDKSGVPDISVGETAQQLAASSRYDEFKAQKLGTFAHNPPQTDAQTKDTNWINEPTLQCSSWRKEPAVATELQSFEVDVDHRYEAFGLCLDKLGILSGYICCIREDGTVSVQIKGESLERWRNLEFSYDPAHPVDKVVAGRIYVVERKYEGGKYLERATLSEDYTEEGYVCMNLIDNGHVEAIDFHDIFELINETDVAEVPAQAVDVWVVGLSHCGYSSEELLDLEKDWNSYEEVYIIPVHAPPKELLQVVIVRRNGETLGIRALPASYYA